MANILSQEEMDALLEVVEDEGQEEVPNNSPETVSEKLDYIIDLLNHINAKL
jgi:flagellar motor switch protein FliM